MSVLTTLAMIQTEMCWTVRISVIWLITSLWKHINKNNICNRLSLKGLHAHTQAQTHTVSSTHTPRPTHTQRHTQRVPWILPTDLEFCSVLFALLQSYDCLELTNLSMVAWHLNILWAHLLAGLCVSHCSLVVTQPHINFNWVGAEAMTSREHGALRATSLGWPDLFHTGLQ